MAVVGEHALDADAVFGGEPGDRPLQEGAGVLGALARQDLAVGDPAVVVDGHVQVLPAGTGRALDAVGEDPLADV